MTTPKVALPLLSALSLLVPAGVVAAPLGRTVTFTAVTTSSVRNGGALTITDADLSGSTVVGHDTLVCSQVVGRCVIRFTLSGGTITGRFAASGTSGTGPILSGTGSYRGATGTVAWKNLNESGTRTGITLSLR